MKAIQQVLIFAVGVASASAANATTTIVRTTQAQTVTGAWKFTVQDIQKAKQATTQTACKAILHEVCRLAGVAVNRKCPPAYPTTATCSFLPAPRRLSEGRRLAQQRVTHSYTMNVPAGSTVAASTISSAIRGQSIQAITNAIAAATGLAASSITGVTNVPPTVANYYDVSSSKRASLLVGAALILRALM